MEGHETDDSFDAILDCIMRLAHAAGPDDEPLCECEGCRFSHAREGMAQDHDAKADRGACEDGTARYALALLQNFGSAVANLRIATSALEEAVDSLKLSVALQTAVALILAVAAIVALMKGVA